MAINLNINIQLLKEAQRLGGYETKRETVNQALDEFVQRRLRQDFLNLENDIDYHPKYDFKQTRQKR